MTFISSRTPHDQTPRWKSSRDEMKDIPGWNSSRGLKGKTYFRLFDKAFLLWAILIRHNALTPFCFFFFFIPIQLKLRPRLHDWFHPGMSFIPGWLSSHPGMTFISVSGYLPLSVYMIWSKNVFAPGWFHPGLQHRDEIIPGRTHFCSKSCKHLQVNDQTPSWKSSRDEMQVIPGWNSSRDEITHVNGA